MPETSFDRLQFATKLSEAIKVLVQDGLKAGDLEAELGESLGYLDPRQAQEYIRFLRSKGKNKGLPESPHKMPRNALVEKLSRKLVEMGISDSLLIEALLIAGGFANYRILIEELFPQEIIPNVEKSTPLKERLKLRKNLRPRIYDEASGLVGVQEFINSLKTLLGRLQPPLFISLEGTGGVGKTAIAQDIAYYLSEHPHFDQILWVNAQRHRFITRQDFQITQSILDDVLDQMVEQMDLHELAYASTQEKIARLMGSPVKTLVVIDNLETQTDVNNLIPYLYPMGNPYYFLITTRYSLKDYNYVYCRAVPKLDIEAGRQLITNEMYRLHGVNAPTTKLDLVDDIYLAGHELPLAIKLIISQLTMGYNTQAIAHLKQQRLNNKWYSYLYLNTWQMLSPQSQGLLLLSLPIPQQGETVEWLLEVSNLIPSELQASIDELRNYMLFEVLIGEGSNLYRIHSLTAEFLENFVLRNSLELTGYDEQLSPTWGIGIFSLCLTKVTQYVEAETTEVQPHLDYIFSLLEYAYTSLELHSQAIELISTLVPIPFQLGIWNKWERALRFAIPIVRNSNRRLTELKLLEHLAQILFNTGRFEEAQDISSEAIELSILEENYDFLVKSTNHKIASLLRIGKKELAENLVDELGERLATFYPPASARIQFLLMKIDLLYYDANYQKARILVNEITDSLENLSSGKEKLVAESLQARGILNWKEGKYEDALHDLLTVYQHYLDKNDSFAEAFTLGNVSLIYWSMNRFAEAESVTLQSIDAYTRINAKSYLVNKWGDLGLIYLEMGNLDKASIYIDLHLEMAKRLNLKNELLRAYGNRGLLYFVKMDFEAAIQDLRMDYDNSQTIEGKAIAGLFLALCYIKYGRFDQGERIFENAYQLSKQVDVPYLEIFALRCLAEFQEVDKRISTVNAALRLSQDHSRRMDEAKCLIGLAQINPVPEAASQQWQQAKAILQELGALDWILHPMWGTSNLFLP